jgi:hypothetical protein
MEIAIVAGLFTERNMDVDTGHCYEWYLERDKRILIIDANLFIQIYCMMFSLLVFCYSFVTL